MPERKTPQVRFKGFTDTWEQRKLSEVTTEFNSGEGIKADEIEENGTYPVYGGNGLRGYTERYNHDGEYALIGRQGALCGNMNYSVGKAYFTEHAVAVKANESNDTRFLYYLLDRMDLGRYSDQSAQPGLAVNKLIVLHTYVPRKQEQEAIGVCFKSLDHLITLHQRECERLQMVKKSMLENCFPKNGEKVPRFRFAGFTSDWEQRKLGDIFDEYSEKGHPELPALTIIQGGGTIRRDESGRSLQYDKASLANYKMVNDGDFIVHLRSFEGGLEKATALGIISPAYHTFHGEGTDSRFYYSYFRSPKFIDQDLKPHVYGIRDGRSIDIEGMKTIEIPWTNFAEQKAIGDYIDTLDTLIALHQRKEYGLKTYENRSIHYGTF